MYHHLCCFLTCYYRTTNVCHYGYELFYGIAIAFCNNQNPVTTRYNPAS